MNVGDRRLGGGQQIKLPKARGVESLLDGISLIFKFGKLPNTNHAVAADDVGRRNLRVAVLRRMQIKQELDQRPFQFRSAICVKQKPAAGKFRATSIIDEAQTFA